MATKKTTSELVVFSKAWAEMITARTHGTGVVGVAHLLQSNKQISLLANGYGNKKTTSEFVVFSKAWQR